eukprot:3598486-Rhodomonas_salina.1
MRASTNAACSVPRSCWRACGGYVVVVCLAPGCAGSFPGGWCVRLRLAAVCAGSRLCSWICYTAPLSENGGGAPIRSRAIAV